jgi:hypothetical protein
VYYTSSRTGASSSSGKKHSCFAGTETVQLTDGSHIMLSDVVVGDVVSTMTRDGVSRFSEVIAVPHQHNSELATFLNIKVSSGAEITLTAEHLLMVADKCIGSAELLAADKVRVGSCLITSTGPKPVVSVDLMQRKGLYTIVTDDEFLLVNGIMASPFAVNHAVANAYYNVLRAFPVLRWLLNTNALLTANSLLSDSVESLLTF